MSHPQQKEFVQKIKDRFLGYFSNKKVLEVGSYNINGTMRDFFTECDYTGLDVSEGAGVDIVCKGHEYNEKPYTFDVTLSCECFEHDMYWDLSFKNMYRLLKVDGLLFFTCASAGRPEHGTLQVRPQDSLTTGISEMANYYKNLTAKDFEDKFNLSEMFSEYCFDRNDFSCDLYFYGIKR